MGSEAGQEQGFSGFHLFASLSNHPAYGSSCQAFRYDRHVTCDTT